MKQLNLITGLLTVVLLVSSCSSDNDPGNQNPEKTVLISPANQTQGVELENLNLQWQQVMDPDGNTVSYDVYLDSVNPPAETVAADLNTTAYSLQETLAYNKPYYWRVTAKDGNGGESQSEVAMFTTREGKAEELIVGKWLLAGHIVNGTPEPISECKKTSYFEFEADGTLTAVIYGGDPCAITTSAILEYSVPDASTLVITNGEISESTPIVTLTETELQFFLDEVQQYNFVRGN